MPHERQIENPGSSDVPGVLPTHTKIIATIGPASDSPEMVRKLIENGVSIFRFNFSHGTLEDHARRLEVVREQASLLERQVAAMGDLQGPKIRIGKVEGALTIEAGQDVVLSNEVDVARHDANGTPTFPTTYPQMVEEVQPGQRILINDGAIRMLAVEVTPTSVRCRVTTGGLVTSGKGINLPESDVKAPALTERDWTCVEWAVGKGLDLLALSFVRTASEVLQLKSHVDTMCSAQKVDSVGDQASRIPVISKIEKPQAVEHLDEIIEASDGIMVARGDLGVEMDVARVPVVQKHIIAKCAAWGKPCIVATQMLETMIESPMPTRAEANDVATAIFDGADCVMLSAETATGAHPDLVVETMRRIADVAEHRVYDLPRRARPPERYVQMRTRSAALAHGAWHVANDIHAKLIVCWSQTGGLARFLSQNNFPIPIIAYTSDARFARRMAVLRGVIPIHAEPPETGRLADWNHHVDELLIEKKWAKLGDPIVMLAGKPLGEKRRSNTIAIHQIGEHEFGYHAHDT